MSVKLHLTTYEKPLMEKVLKANKIKLKLSANGLDLTSSDYGAVNGALHDAYFKANFAKDSQADALQVIMRKMEKIAVHFPFIEEKVNEKIKEGLEENMLPVNLSDTTLEDWRDGDDVTIIEGGKIEEQTEENENNDDN